jgi:hypothetical protein
MTNTARGETSFLANGEKFVMRLTLGALAEIESGLSLTNLSTIAERLKQLSSSDIAVIAAALLRGGGHDVTAADVMRIPADVGTIVGAVSDALSALGAKEGGKADATIPLPGAGASASASAS